jgi:hypothetical protein
MKESPQTGSHLIPVLGHKYPCSIWHEELQPSIPILFPSSQLSTPDTLNPSPQTALQGLLGDGQIYPVSN